MWTAWRAASSSVYEEAYYRSNALVTFFNTSGHKIAERDYTSRHSFPRVLEVGAGNGFHLRFVRHAFEKYYVTDIDDVMLDIARERYANVPSVNFQKEDASELSFPDGHFDRLISVFNLEHLHKPHLVLQEWRRVVREDGIITIAIPADGGVAWRLGRFLTTRRYFKKRGLNLDYIIAREHVNPAYNLIPLIRHYLRPYREIFFPSVIGLIDLNLVYVCQARRT